MNEAQIQISLGDKRMKEISEVMANKTCTKILDYLSTQEEEVTVSDLATALKIPLNTTDYNVKKLVKAGLIEKTGQWWSVKGKKMPAYKISNKKIVISPKRTASKHFMLTLGLALLAAFMINTLQPTVTTQENALVQERAVADFAEEALDQADSAGFAEPSALLVQAPEETTVTEQEKLSVSPEPETVIINHGLLFFSGAVFAILLLVVFVFFERRKKG